MPVRLESALARQWHTRDRAVKQLAAVQSQSSVVHTGQTNLLSFSVSFMFSE